jgi:hypothetical protein
VTESLLDKYAPRPDAGSRAAVDAESETETTVCFRCLRASAKDRAVMIQLQKTDGTIRAIPYSYIESMEFAPSDGITLRANGSQTIRIKGRNLNRSPVGQPRLFEALSLHRVLWVREVGRTANIPCGHEATVVEAIDW